MHEDTKFKQVSTAYNFKVLCKKIDATEGPMCNLQFLTKNNCDNKNPPEIVHIEHNEFSQLASTSIYL